MIPTTCIGEPVSWLRLEQLALGELSVPAARAVTAHLDDCAACRACMDSIHDDSVALPALPAIEPVPERVPWWRRRWTWGVAGGLAAAIAALLLYLRPPGDRAERGIDETSVSVRIKGAGLVEVGLVRERAGATLINPTSFRAGDRFKVIVTCGEAADVWADIGVYQPDPANRGGPLLASYPAAPLRLTCGNHVPLPGAFTITGPGPAWVCLALDIDHAPTRELLGRRKGIACRQLSEE